MPRSLLALLLGLPLVLVALGTPIATTAQPSACRFVLGFADLRDQLGVTTVGECLEDEQHNVENGDGRQRTTRGEMVWRKASNTMAFTDGYRTWVVGPDGLQQRLNTERFAWEPDASMFPRPGQAATTASGAPTPTRAASPSPTVLSPSRPAASPLPSLPAAGSQPIAPTVTPTASPGADVASGPTPTSTPAPTATPRPPGSAFNPNNYVGQGNVYDCTDFSSQADAQAVLRADPTDPNRLDGSDEDGIACRRNPPPYDRTPVPRP